MMPRKEHQQERNLKRSPVALSVAWCRRIKCLNFWLPDESALRILRRIAYWLTRTQLSDQHCLICQPECLLSARGYATVIPKDI
jgi:hypothetical protein